MSEQAMTVLALVGSLRRGSFNKRLAEAAVELAPNGMSIVLYDGLGELPLFDEDLEAAGSLPTVMRLRDAVQSVHGLLIATAEYNHGVPAVLKNALDWLSRPSPDEVLVGKPVIAMGATTGAWGTRLAQASLRQTLFATQAALMPKPALHLRSASELFIEGRLADAAMRQSLAAQLVDFMQWMRGVRALLSPP